MGVQGPFRGGLLAGNRSRGWSRRDKAPRLQPSNKDRGVAGRIALLKDPVELLRFQEDNVVFGEEIVVVLDEPGGIAN
jgi:hypothetical protein